MEKVLRAVMAPILILLSGADAFALSFCTAPSAPSFYQTKPIEPREPYCVNKYAMTHNCSDWEISRYESELATYKSSMSSYVWAANRYIDELNEYVKKAKNFAVCEADALK